MINLQLLIKNIMIIEIIGPPGLENLIMAVKFEFNNEIYSDTDIRNELSSIKKIISIKVLLDLYQKFLLQTDIVEK